MKVNKVGIVLSGGGAKGAYQIGVWKALKKLKIKYDVVTGTSVGALNGLLFVQKDYRKAHKIWKNLNYNIIFDDISNLKNENAYKTYIKETVKKGGMNVNKLKELIDKVFDERKFYSSKIDYGIVVFNLSKLKAEMLSKSELTKDKIKDYVLASSTFFPFFKLKNIQGENYIDGGVYDNMPINLCAELGANKIIVIDMKAIGIKQKVKDKNLEIITIAPKNKIIPLLIFDKALSIKTMKFGYNDTMKKFGIYDGKIFTFKKNKISLYENVMKTMSFKILSFLSDRSKHQIFMPISKFALIDILENLGETFDLNQEKIYSIKRFNKELISKLNKDDDGMTQKIDKKVLAQSNSIKRKPYFIKYIIRIILSRNNKMIQVLAKNYPRDFLGAVYLYTLIYNKN
ncbi:MAG: patatin-like phospholipase family protein [Clostridium sp.]|nr:patatin-like phospholipase family protein [Clostridium sp.]MCM1443894.1 patatin-like phospholipase family protein [Candidatus Amulumruptor caecigallinarius]